MSLLDLGNVERPVVDNQVEGWPVERCGQWSGISLMDPGNLERPSVETQVRRMASGKMWLVEWYLTDGPR
jgi:hypothetical protein